MPPPVCFHGPFVRVDDLIEKFRNSDLPDKSEFLKHKQYVYFCSTKFLIGCVLINIKFENTFTITYSNITYSL